MRASGLPSRWPTARRADWVLKSTQIDWLGSAAGNIVIAAEETFDGTFPFALHYSEAPGFRMHYLEEGVGPPIVCLHGEPT